MYVIYLNQCKSLHNRPAVTESVSCVCLCLLELIRTGFSPSLASHHAVELQLCLDITIDLVYLQGHNRLYEDSINGMIAWVNILSEPNYLQGQMIP